jgi:hypothetical protein
MFVLLCRQQQLSKAVVDLNSGLRDHYSETSKANLAIFFV